MGKLNTAETRISSLEPNSKLLKPIAGIKGAVNRVQVKLSAAKTPQEVQQQTTTLKKLAENIRKFGDKYKIKEFEDAAPSWGLSNTERKIVSNLPGGKELLSKLERVDENKRRALIEEARLALNINRNAADDIVAIGKDIFNPPGSTKSFTEIDLETKDYMIQIKGGDYSSAKKLSGADMIQFTRTKQYNQNMLFDSKTGNKLPPKKLRYHFFKEPVDPRLIKWLTDKKIDQVTTGKL
ncbi:MAG: hypothetical protein F6K47_34665 [Symploca sp. SIO2E6]|nr:hypothetical protein [Symploca sp. SIO2E6]